MDSINSSRWAARNEARATRARPRNTLPSIVTEYTWMETSAENQGPRVVTATARARIATRPKRATKTKFIVADRRDRPTPPGALAQARYLIRAGRSCGASAGTVGRSVIINESNYESETVNCPIRVDLVGVRIVYNATSGSNETIEVNRTTWSTFNVTLADGKSWTQSYTFRIDAVGLWKVQFLLFRDREFLSVYRELHLFGRVS